MINFRIRHARTLTGARGPDTPKNFRLIKFTFRYSKVTEINLGPSPSPGIVLGSTQIIQISSLVFLTGHNCKAPDGHLLNLGETYYMNSYTKCYCDTRHFGSYMAVCTHMAIDPVHVPHVDPNNPYYYVTSYVDPPQVAPVDPGSVYYPAKGR